MSGGRWLGYALAALLLAAVLLRGGVSTAAAPALYLGAAGLGFAAALARNLGCASRDALGVALLWGALALAQVGWSADRDAALDGAAALLAAALVFLLVHAGLGEVERRRMAVAIGAIGAAVAALAIASMTPGVRASFPLGNPNHLAGWLLLPAAVASAGLFLTQEGEDRRFVVFWFGVLLLSGAGMAISGSRGGGLAAAAAVGALVALVRAPRRLGAPVVTAALAAVGIALATLPAARPGLIPAARDASESSMGIRWQVYEVAAHSALDAAPLGVGLGGFAAAFATHRPADLPYAPRFAHNEFLHGAVELGAPFLLALGATGVLVLRRVLRGRERPRALASWGGSAAIVAIAAHSLVDFTLHVPAIALAGAAAGGLAWGAAGRVSAGGRCASQRATQVALSALAAVLVLLAGSEFAALRAAARAEEHLRSGDFADAERSARSGLRARPARSQLWRLVAEAAEHSHELGGGGAAALQRALSARAAAVEASPRQAGLHAERARTLAKVGDLEGALAALDRAIRLDPAAPGLRLSRARLLLADSRADDAARAVRAAVQRRPVAALDALGALLRATGDPALARAAVPDDPRAMLGAGRALARAGYRWDAARVFERAAALQPADPGVALEASRALRAAGEAHHAAAVVERTLEFEPGHPRLRDELERIGRAMSVGAGPGAERDSS
ncbi:MAG: O-antigen ligase family protein [Myxococcota bacterium]